MPSEIETEGLALHLEMENRMLRTRVEALEEQQQRATIASVSQYQELRRRYDEARQTIIERETEIQGLRQTLVALRIQLRADGRERWEDAIAWITRIVEPEELQS